MMPKVIFFIVPQLRYGGGEKQFYLLLKYIDRTRFRPCVICLEKGGDLVDVIRGLEIEVFEIPGGKIYQIKSMVALFRKYKPEVVHTWLNNEWGRIAAILHRFSGGAVKIIASERDEMHHSSRRFRGFFILFGRFLSFFSDAVTFNSPKALNAFADGWYNRKACVFIGNGVEAKEIKNNIQADSENKLVVAVVARLVSQKSHDFLLRALSKFERRNQCEVWLLGDGNLRVNLERLSAQLELEQCVKFLGARTDIPSYLTQASVGMLVSSSEGFSNAVLEYLANGLAVVLTDAGANSMCVDQNGFIVSDESDIVKALSFYLDNPSVLREHRLRSLALAREYGIENIVSLYQRLYLNG